MFNYDSNFYANFGAKIVVVASLEVSQKFFKWRGEHDNTNASGSYLTYYPNDIVRINVLLITTFQQTINILEIKSIKLEQLIFVY